MWGIRFKAPHSVSPFKATRALTLAPCLALYALLCETRGFDPVIKLAHLVNNDIIHRIILLNVFILADVSFVLIISNSLYYVCIFTQGLYVNICMDRQKMFVNISGELLIGIIELVFIPLVTTGVVLG